MIGLVHAYLIWWGDILVLYAECGLFLYFFRNLGPRTLIIVGFVAMMLLVPLILGFAAGFDFARRAAARYEAHIQDGEWRKITVVDYVLHYLWTEHLREVVDPNPEKQAKEWNEEMAAYRGGYVGIVKHRAPELIKEHTFGFMFGGGLFAMSRMLIGMGLMKLGVSRPVRSRKFYWWMVGLGYGIGLPLMIFDASKLIETNFRSNMK